jgi:hypothetical protein
VQEDAEGALRLEALVQIQLKQAEIVLEGRLTELDPVDFANFFLRHPTRYPSVGHFFASQVNKFVV